MGQAFEIVFILRSIDNTINVPVYIPLLIETYFHVRFLLKGRVLNECHKTMCVLHLFSYRNKCFIYIEPNTIVERSPSCRVSDSSTHR